VASIEDFIETVDEQARRLVSDTHRAYDVGLELWKLGMGGIPDEFLRDVAWPLWLIWGALTDRVESSEPGAEAEAAAAMKRAATEWLAISRDTEARRQYLDRWVYAECGYERPGPGDGP
jgi:hypothetical protein